MIEQVLGWVVGMLTVWAVWSSVVSVTFDKAVKPALDKLFVLLGYAPQLTPLRPLAIIGGVFVAAWLAVKEGGLNLFETAPRVVTELVPNGDLQLGLTALFLAVGAFIYHDASRWYTGKNIFAEYKGGMLTEANLPQKWTSQ